MGRHEEDCLNSDVGSVMMVAEFGVSVVGSGIMVVKLGIRS